MFETSAHGVFYFLFLISVDTRFEKGKLRLEVTSVYGAEGTRGMSKWVVF